MTLLQGEIGCCAALGFITAITHAAQPQIWINCDCHHGTIGLGSHYRGMGRDSLSPKHFCPGCGRPMGVTRTVPASPGYSELRTYGCRECGVWVTEGRAPEDEREDSFILRK